MRAPLVVLMLLAVAFVPTAGAGTSNDCKGSSRLVFHNDNVRVWFHGFKDFFKVFDTPAASGSGQSSPGGSDTNGTDAEGRHYDYHAGSIIERDASNATVASMNLERAFPQTSQCTITETDEFVNMTLVVTDKLDGAFHGETATVGMTFHFNKSAEGVKFDLDVQKWPWHAAGQSLAFAFRLDTSNLTIVPASNGAGFQDDNGTDHGYVQWAPNATATYADGSQQQANVTANESGDAHHLDVTLGFDNVPPGYVDLAYDPWMGAGDFVIVANLLVGLAPVEEVLPAGALAQARAAL